MQKRRRFILVRVLICSFLFLGVVVPVLQLATGDHQFRMGPGQCVQWLPADGGEIRNGKRLFWYVGSRVTLPLHNESWQVDTVQLGRLQWYEMRPIEPSGTN